MWIESHQSLRQHPKTIKAARCLGISKVTLIGHLHCLWWWSLDYAQNGDLSAYDAIDIAAAADWEGDAEQFVNALLASRIGDNPGFLERTTDGRLLVHDWHDYAGKLIEKRTKDARRKRNERRNDDQPTPDQDGDDIRRTSAGHPPDVGVTAQVPNQPTLTIPTLTELTAKECSAPTTTAAAPPASLPEAVKVYEKHGGTYPAGKLTDGTSKRDRARQFIAEHIRDDPTSLALWGRVVAGYCAQWSSKSYTVMINDYYLAGKVPGERSNSNGKSGTHRAPGLASLRSAIDDEYDAANTPDKLAAAQAEWNRRKAERERGNVS